MKLQELQRIKKAALRRAAVEDSGGTPG